MSRKPLPRLPFSSRYALATPTPADGPLSLPTLCRELDDQVQANLPDEVRALPLPWVHDGDPGGLCLGLQPAGQSPSWQEPYTSLTCQALYSLQRTW